MFTGLIETTGTVLSLAYNESGARLRLSPARVFEDLVAGDSVAVNGVCLTAIQLAEGAFSADLSHETLSRSNLGGLHVGDRVNLERAMAANGRFGGHMVSGHIDAVGSISEVQADGDVLLLHVWLPDACRRWIIEKGSIAIDGISLTIVAQSDDGVHLAIIPHSLQSTTLAMARPGQKVNIECDQVAKYIDHFLHLGPPAQKDDDARLETLLSVL